MAANLNVVGCLQGTTPGHMVQQPVPPKRELVARPLRFNNKQLKPTRSIVTTYLTSLYVELSQSPSTSYSTDKFF